VGQIGNSDNGYYISVKMSVTWPSQDKRSTFMNVYEGIVTVGLYFFLSASGVE